MKNMLRNYLGEGGEGGVNFWEGKVDPPSSRYSSAHDISWIIFEDPNKVSPLVEVRAAWVRKTRIKAGGTEKKKRGKRRGKKGWNEEKSEETRRGIVFRGWAWKMQNYRGLGENSTMEHG